MWWVDRRMVRPGTSRTKQGKEGAGKDTHTHNGQPVILVTWFVLQNEVPDGTASIGVHASSGLI